MTGEELRSYRLNHVLTQQRLGQMLGYKGKSAENVVQLWEYNKQPIPIKHWRKLSQILEIPLDKFIP